MTIWASERSRNGGVDEIPLPVAADANGPGRLWLCGKHFIGPDPEAALQRVGATGVVCLNEAAELTDRYPDYVRWLGANQPARALWYPIPDLHAPPPEAAVGLLDELQTRLASGQSLLMHCGAGIGRAGTMAAGLLIALGVPLPEAVTHVRACRPMAGPEVGAQTELLQALVRHFAALAPEAPAVAAAVQIAAVPVAGVPVAAVPDAAPAAPTPVVGPTRTP
jgi:protein-tyrosine phosphatase